MYFNRNSLLKVATVCCLFIDFTSYSSSASLSAYENYMIRFSFSKESDTIDKYFYFISKPSNIYRVFD